MNELHYFGYISTAIILHCGLVDNTTLLQTDKRGAACQVSLMQYTVQYLKLLLSCIFLLSEIPYTHCMVGCKEIFSTFQSFYFIHYSPPTRSATGWMILYFGFCNNFFWLISRVWGDQAHNPTLVKFLEDMYLSLRVHMKNQKLCALCWPDCEKNDSISIHKEEILGYLL
jgi:hypothetical protein